MCTLFILLISIVTVFSQTKLYAPFPTNGRTTCNDQTPRKDLYAGRYVNGPLGGQTFPRNTKVANVDECFSLCSAEPDCSAFTFYSGPCNLFLKRSTACTPMTGGGTGTFNGVFSAISENGYRTCNDATCRKDFYAGTYQNCPGKGYFGQQVIPNLKSCATQCLAEPGCTYFTFYSFGACNLFIPTGGVCTEGPSGAAGSWYRYGSSSSVNALEEENHEENHEDSSTVLEGNKETNDPQSLIAGLSAGLGVAGFLVLVLFGVVVALLVKWGKKSDSEKENSVELL